MVKKKKKKSSSRNSKDDEERKVPRRLFKLLSFGGRFSIGSNDMVRFENEYGQEDTEIRLFQMGVDDDRVWRIANSLRKQDHRHILTLNLSHNRFGPDGAYALSIALRENQTLQRLFLGGNNIGTSGVSALAEALSIPTATSPQPTPPSSPSIRCLALPQTQIGDAGAKALAACLHTNTSLEELFLQSNLISNPGTAELARALRHNPALRSLDLSDNCIGDDGVRCLAEELPHNRTLQHLFLGDNHFSTRGLGYLVGLAKQNAFLTILDSKTHCRGVVTEESRTLYNQINYYVSLNAAGRAMIRDNDIHGGVLPHLLEKNSTNLEILYGLIREQPYLFSG